MNDPFDQISPAFILLFRQYTRLLFYRRFKYVWIKDGYAPPQTRSTLYYANHTSWWDGLIPFLLNEFHFRQNGRAIMEYVQMQQYDFFRKIGAVAIDPQNARQSLRVLNQAAGFLSIPGRSLYFYPQGEMFTESAPLHFQGGLTRLSGICTNTDIVPLAITITTIRYDKPELLLRTDEPVNISESTSKQERTRIFEARLQNLLNLNQKACKTGSNGYQRLI